MALKLSTFFISKGYLNDIKTYRLSNLDLRTARIALKIDIDSFFVNGLIK